MPNVPRTGCQPSLIAPEIATLYEHEAEIVLLQGDCLTTLPTLPRASMKLIITSPPYNLGKVYEKATELERYLDALSPIVDELIRVVSSRGSICWQVGNYVEDSEIFPLDVIDYPMFKKPGLKLRNRIVCQSAHGLHAREHRRMAA